MTSEALLLRDGVRGDAEQLLEHLYVDPEQPPSDTTPLVGFAVVDGDWTDMFRRSRTVRVADNEMPLLEDAQRASTGRLALHVFTRNQRARYFYEVAGFILGNQSDGSDNEEREPDCTYTWTASTTSVR